MSRGISISIIILVIVVFFGTTIIKDYQKKCDYFCSSIFGTIEEHRLTKQGIHVIKLKQDEDWIYLQPNVSIDSKLKVGDTIKKDVGDFDIYIFVDEAPKLISTSRNNGSYQKLCKCNKHR